MRKKIGFFVLTTLLLLSIPTNIRAAAPEPSATAESLATETDSEIIVSEEAGDVSETENVLETAGTSETMDSESLDLMEDSIQESDILTVESVDTNNPYVKLDAFGRAYLVNESGKRIQTPGTPIVGGKKYYVASDGYLRSGWMKVADWTLYFDPVDFHAYTNGVHLINGKYYLFNTDGVRVESTGTPIINGKKYLIQSDYSLHTGWLKFLGWSLYFDPTDCYAYTNGAHSVDGKYYLFDADGIRIESTGTPIIDGKKYLIQSDYSLRTGWVGFLDWLLYFDPTNCYAYTNGAYSVDGKYYLFNADGIRIESTGTPIIDGKKYLIQSDYSLRTGWVKFLDWALYFDPTYCYAYTNGAFSVDGKYYLFNADGVRVESTGTPIIDGKKYWIESDYSLHRGWANFLDWTLYFDPTYCYAYTDGVHEVEGVNKLFNPDGILFEGPQNVFYKGLLYAIDENDIATVQYTEAQRYAEQILNQVGWNLRAAYNWSAGLTYANRSLRAPANSVHSEYYAVYGFQNHSGNCYVMASTFCQMARLLGYEAYLVEGQVPLARGGKNDHGWCELVINGTTYVFDPNFTNETGRNGYQINYGMSGTWRYVNYRRVN